MSSAFASTKLSPHFTAGELGVDGVQVPASVAANARALADYLEVVRASLGVPLRITSGYRPPAYNAAVGGVPNSAHQYGLAADFIPLGPATMYQTFQQLQSAGLPAWDQLIYYPSQGHIHLAIGGQLRREVRIRLHEGPGGTPLVDASNLAALPGAVGDAVVATLTNVGGSVAQAAGRAGASPTLVHTSPLLVGAAVLIVFTLLLVS